MLLREVYKYSFIHSFILSTCFYLSSGLCEQCCYKESKVFLFTGFVQCDFHSVILTFHF